GKPMRRAFLRPYGGPNRLLEPSRDGKFSIEFPGPGGYEMYAGGVHHQSVWIPLLLQDAELRLDVRLAPARVREPRDGFRVGGVFNAFARRGAVPMHKRSDGFFAATIDCKVDTLRYQLLGVQVGAEPICGTQADAFQFDRERPIIDDLSGKYVALL